MKQVEQAQIFFDILRKLYAYNDEKGIYQIVLNEAVLALDCEAGTLYMADIKSASLNPVASVGPPLEKLKKLPFKFGLGLCGWVAQNNDSLIINDVKNDNRFNDLYDKTLGFTTKSILCAPLPVREECLGVIELFNRKDRQFHPEDLQLLSMLGKHMAVALENVLLYQKLNKLNAFNTSILNCLPGGFVGVDKDGMVNVCNDKAMEILHLESTVVGLNMNAAFKDRLLFLAILQMTIKENTVFFRRDLLLPIGDTNIKIGYSTIFIQNEHNNLVGYGIVFQNISGVSK